MTIFVVAMVLTFVVWMRTFYRLGKMFEYEHFFAFLVLLNNLLRIYRNKPTFSYFEYGSMWLALGIRNITLFYIEQIPPDFKTLFSDDDFKYLNKVHRRFSIANFDHDMAKYRHLLGIDDFDRSIKTRDKKNK